MARLANPTSSWNETSRIPTDRLGDLIGDEHMSEESAETTPGHSDDEEWDQHCLCLPEPTARGAIEQCHPRP